MPHFNKKFRKQVLPIRKMTHSNRESPTDKSERESNNERRNEKIQQNDIDRDLGDMKKGIDEVRSFLTEEQIKKKMEKMLKKLPIENRTRNLLDEDRDIINNNKSRSKLRIKK